jgi:Mn2+/Fe2+ NRAMP family transporter
MCHVAFGTGQRNAKNLPPTTKGIVDCIIIIIVILFARRVLIVWCFLSFGRSWHGDHDDRCRSGKKKKKKHHTRYLFIYFIIIIIASSHSTISVVGASLAGRYRSAHHRRCGARRLCALGRHCRTGSVGRFVRD